MNKFKFLLLLTVSFSMGALGEDQKVESQPAIMKTENGIRFQIIAIPSGFPVRAIKIDTLTGRTWILHILDAKTGALIWDEIPSGDLPSR